MLVLIWEFTFLLLIIFVASHAMSVATEKLSKRWGPNFAGSILLGLVTVLPEYLFVFWAVRKGKYNVALGSVTGAAAMLVTLGYGLVILTATSRFSRRPVETIELSTTTRIDALYLFVTAVIAVVLGLAGNGLSMMDAAILTVIYFAYAVHLYHEARKKSREGREAGGDVPPGDAQPARRADNTQSREGRKAGGDVPVLKPLLTLSACGVVVLLVSEKFVDSMVELASVLGVPPLAIAVIISPIASEMPEKLTAFITVHRDGHLAEMSVCNFIGSKVNHNSLLLAMMPLVAFFSGRESFIPGIVVPAFWMMTALTMVAGVSLSLGRLRHWQGWFFVLLFLFQVAVAIFYPQGPLAVPVAAH